MDRSLMRPADRLFTPDHARCPTPHGPFGQTSSPDYPGTPAFRRSRSKAAPTASPRTPSRSAAALLTAISSTIPAITHEVQKPGQSRTNGQNTLEIGSTRGRTREQPYNNAKQEKMTQTS